MSYKIGCLPVLDSFHCCCFSCALKTSTLVIGCLTLVGSSLQIAAYIVYWLKFEETGPLLWFDSPELCLGLISEGAVLAFCSLLLLLGTCNEWSWLMLPHVVVYQLVVAGLVAAVLIFGFSVLFKQFFLGLFIILGGASVAAVAFYLWLVIYSYYRTLIDKKRRSRLRKEDLSIEKTAPEQEILTQQPVK
ncbi:uncharacterized protein [Periplaneta americana]|uniref:uncharacterized protein n=1 Tax=Periplaneta americana TaxID=6978 RepID=UPI0037E84070